MSPGGRLNVPRRETRCVPAGYPAVQAIKVLAPWGEHCDTCRPARTAAAPGTTRIGKLFLEHQEQPDDNCNDAYHAASYLARSETTPAANPDSVGCQRQAQKHYPDHQHDNSDDFFVFHLYHLLSVHVLNITLSG